MEVHQLMRNAAAAQGVRENVDFCVQCQSYKLLFAEADRIPRAQTIWETFLSPAAETPVNISDTLIKKIEPKIKTADAEVFELAYNEVLQIISDNLFSHYLKAIEHAKKESEAKKKEEADGASAPAPPSSGGCCLLM
uniref:RGS domain-containing protein n=1 Tax=Haptolina brevifila TaxID=156173 RepID=A0A7S2G9E6_9EUKA